MKKIFVLFIALCYFILPTGCNSINTEQPAINIEDTKKNIESTVTNAEDSETKMEKSEMKTEDMKMNIQIGDASFTATLEDNAAVRELVEMMQNGPITIDMNDYSGFEKVGSLTRSLTTDNHQTTTSSGDIVLYNSNQIVMFYGSNSWSYTRIGRIDDLYGWEEALGNGNITAVFSLNTNTK